MKIWVIVGVRVVLSTRLELVVSLLVIWCNGRAARFWVLWEIVVHELVISERRFRAVLTWWSTLVLEVLVVLIVRGVGWLVVKAAFVVFGLSACVLPVFCVALRVGGDVWRM